MNWIPIEFARISDDGRLTIVVHSGSRRIATYSVEADHEAVGTARENLRLREGPVRCETLARDEWIASVDTSGERRGMIGPVDVDAVREWLRAKGYGSAIWTAIPPRLSHPRHGSIRVLTVEAVVDYLRSLAPELQMKTRDYFRSVPSDIQTQLRRGIERSMGW